MDNEKLIGECILREISTQDDVAKLIGRLLIERQLMTGDRDRLADVLVKRDKELKELGSLRIEKEDLLDTIHAQEQRAAELKKKSWVAGKRVATLERLADDRKEENRALRNKIADKETTINNLRRGRDNAEKDVDQISKELNDVRKTVGELEQEIFDMTR